MKKIDKIRYGLYFKNLLIYFCIFFLAMLVIDNFFEWLYNDSITQELFIKSIPIIFFKALFIAVIISLIDNWSRIVLKSDKGITAEEIDTKLQGLDFHLSDEKDGVSIYKPVKETRNFRKPVLYVQIENDAALIAGRGNFLRMLRENFRREGFEVARKV